MKRPPGSIGETVRLLDLRSAPRLSGRWSEVPRLTWDALRVAWNASRRELVATLLLQAGAGLAITLQLLAAQRVLQRLLAINEAGSSATDLLAPFGMLVGAMILMGALTAFAEQRQRLLAELVAQHAIAQIVGVSARVQLAAFEVSDFYDRLDRARTSAIGRSVQMVGNVSGITLAMLTSGGIAVALLVLEPLLLPLVLVSAVPMLLATIHNSRQAYRFEWAMTPENRERTYLIDLLTRREAAKEIRVFNAASFLRDRYEALTAERLRRMRGFLRERLKVALAGSVGTTAGMGIALAALALLIASGRIEVATALATGAAMQQLSTRLFSMMTNVGAVVESGMFVDDYNSFLRLLPGALEPPTASPAAAARDGGPRFNGLTVENVSFEYPGTGTPVLEGVSLHVDPGEVVALVGENGSGKTTLVKLICQLYEPKAGRIAWNGADGSEVDPRAIREQTTVLFQDFLHYYLTAGDNIALGRVQRERTAASIREAAEHAGADRFLSQLPSGYETRLGRQFRDGRDLSVGQWQRLALARAFYRGGDFLVLDEPTASLDPKAEHELFQQMRKLWSGRAVLLVSHRFSSVRSADRIYVLRDGRVIEHGAHADLIAAEGHYAELFSLQAAAYRDRSDGVDRARTQKNATAAGVPRI